MAKLRLGRIQSTAAYPVNVVEQEQASEDSTGEQSPESQESEQSEQNLLDRTIDRVDAWHRGVPALAVTFGVAKKFGDDKGGQLAMLLAYKGFFSLFPLMLAFVNALGLILRNNEDLQNKLIDSVLGSVPVIGNEISSETGSIGGSAFVLIASILVSIWAGLGLLDMLQESLNTMWEVPQFDRPPWLLRRLRGVPGALLILVCAALTGAGRWLLDGEASAALRWVLSAGLAVLAGAVGYLGLHAVLCARKIPLRNQLPGALATGLGWWALQSLGGYYVTRIVTQSSDTYGVFVLVLGLLSWSYLLGTLYLYSVELAAVLYDRRWPRSLSGRDLTDQDQEAFEALSHREVRVRGTQMKIEVPRNPE